MENKNKNLPSNEDTSWLDELLASSDYGEDAIQEVQAISSSTEDEALERIMQEALSDEWDLSNAILDASPIYDYPEQTQLENAEMQDTFYPDDTQLYDDTFSEESGRKVRPKKKDSYGMFGLPHLASTIIWVLLVIGIGITLGRFLWVCATDVLAFGRENRVTTITITNTDVGNIDAIADRLYSAGLIKYKQLFKVYASLSNADEKISAGTFELNTVFDYNALVKGMSASSSYRETIKVTIPEGYTCAQIFELLEEKGVCTVEELKAYEIQSDYWFLEGSKTDAEYPLEGFLFPDTYNFYINDSAKGVFRRFLARFDDIFTDELKGYIDKLNKRLSTNYDLYDILIVASMIEKESAGSSENYDISSVIYNRLTHSSAYPTLDIDATIVYAQGGNSDYINKNLNSPYNTYKNKGLPPTPISNPCLLSIQAALSPTDTKYYFYALDPSTGLHHFSKTYSEHEAFLKSLK